MASEPTKNSEVDKGTWLSLVIVPDETTIGQGIRSKFLIIILKMVGSQFNIVETIKQ